MLTLWDLLPKRRRPAPPPPARPAVAPRRAAPDRSAAADRYEALTRRMLAEHRVRVRRWRTSMTGVAWEVHYQDGQISRLIEAPRPRGPMSAAIFLHEIGHHAIGFTRYKPRCLEEYHAWAWAVRAMEEHGVTVTDAVRRRMHESLHYAVAKAARRGLRMLPQELLPFVEPPPRRSRRAAGFR